MCGFLYGFEVRALPKAKSAFGPFSGTAGRAGGQVSGMNGEESLVQVGPIAVSLLALALSLVNLYLQRRDRRPRLEIRVRYEYRVGLPDGG